MVVVILHFLRRAGVVKGDDCPSWRGSLVVHFNIWLSKTRRVPILKLLIPVRNKEKKHQNQPR